MASDLFSQSDSWLPKQQSFLMNDPDYLYSYAISTFHVSLLVCYNEDFMFEW